MNWTKLAEFFEQEDGSFDAVHFAYMAVVIVGIALITYLAILHGALPECPASLLTAVVTVVVAKLVQRPMENKTPPEQPK